ncbi:MAG: hypothetical protein JSU68_08465, partial [Phycisphaerales bacterium]
MRSSNRIRLTRVFAVTVMVSCGLAFALTAYAGPDIPDAGRDEYPLDDAVVLRLDESWTLLPDGSVRYEY